jgi:hypothetical protein
MNVIETWTEENFQEILCNDFFEGVQYVCIVLKGMYQIYREELYKGRYTQVHGFSKIKIKKFKILSREFIKENIYNHEILALTDDESDNFILHIRNEKVSSSEEQFIKQALIYSPIRISSFEYYNNELYFSIQDCVYKVIIREGSSKSRETCFKYPGQTLCNYKLPQGRRNEIELCGFDNVKGLILSDQQDLYIIDSKAVYKRSKRKFNLDNDDQNIIIGGVFKNVFIYSQENIIYFVKNVKGTWYDSYIATVPEGYLIHYMTINEKILYICCNHEETHTGGGVILYFELRMAHFKI